MVHVVAVFVELRVEADEKSLGGLKPFRESAAGILIQSRGYFQRSLAKHIRILPRRTGWLGDERECVPAVAGVIPLGSEISRFEVVGENNRCMAGDLSITLEIRGKSFSCGQLALINQSNR